MHTWFLEAYCGNHPNKSKLVLYNRYFNCKNCLKRLYISNKTVHLSYKSCCSVHGRLHVLRCVKEETSLGLQIDGFGLLIM